VQATPDGDFLVFTSFGDLTAGDTSTARQVFQYDAQTGRLTRVSVGLEGFNDNGNVTGRDVDGEVDAAIAIQDYNVGSGERAIARTMSDDGAYVFFQSPVALTPRALERVQVGDNFNGRVKLYAQNIYEYHEGRVSLIGSDAAESINQAPHALIGTSASGGDVFFSTEDRLVGQDTDTLPDFYDARVDGGFPVSAAPAGCQGEACQGLPGEVPSFGSPSSVSFSGVGNTAAPPVAKPVVVSRGLTAAQKLARALAVCRREPRGKRASCRASARRRYGHSHSASAGKSGGRGK
jgi:hypothetical protein